MPESDRFVGTVLVSPVGPPGIHGTGIHAVRQELLPNIESSDGWMGKQAFPPQPWS